MKKILLFAFCFLFCAFKLTLAEFIVPPIPSTPVFDEVGLLTTAEKTALETTIFTLENETHHQLAIAIVKSLQ